MQFDALVQILEEGDTEPDEVSWFLDCGSDATGRFEVEVSGLLGMCRIEGDRLIAIRLVGNAAYGRRVMALIPVPSEPQPGPSELGDAIFHTLPALVSGHIAHLPTSSLSDGAGGYPPPRQLPADGLVPDPAGNIGRTRGIVVADVSGDGRQDIVQSKGTGAVA